jgi:hypothetical protein
MCRDLTVEVTATLEAVAGSASVTSEVLGGPEFTDVGSDHMAYGPMCWLAQEGIATGTVGSDGSAKGDPGAFVSRRVAAAWLHRAAGSPAPSALPTTTPFYDLYVEDDTYAAAMWLEDQDWNLWANETIQSPRTGNILRSFKPGEVVSRAEFALMLHSLAADQGHLDADVFEADGDAAFTDVRTDHLRYHQISWLRDTGVTVGNADGSFAPGHGLYRQTLAAWLYNYAQAVAQEAPAL